MAPKKQWMKLISIDQLNEEYKFGVTEFLNYAFNKIGEEHEVRCPRVKCNNTNYGTRELIQSHLIMYGIVKNYTFWYDHGERLGEPESDNDVLEEIENDDGI